MALGPRRDPRAIATTHLRSLGLACALAALVSLGAPELVRADAIAEATALFTSGNQHLQAAARLRGERRARELEAAVVDYLASLDRVRSRNVLFNAALALEMLGRNEQAFDFLSEYLAVPGLSDEERAEASRRLEQIAPRVAVLDIRSTPAGAEVWIDRRDLAPRGRAPLRVAVSAGEHHLWLRAPEHREAEATAIATTGTVTEVAVSLRPDPVPVQVIAPADGRLSLDGQPIEPGALIPVEPGSHVVRLEVEGAPPVERRFEVVAGSAPLSLTLAPPSAPTARYATLAITSSPAARVMIDGTSVAAGAQIELRVVPGAHEIRIEADAHQPFRTYRELAAGERSSLEVQLAPIVRGGWLDAPRWLVGIPAALGLVAAVILSAVAEDTWQRREGCLASPPSGGPPACVELGERWEALALAADVTWAAAALVGTVAIVLAAIDDRPEAEESQGRFAIVPWLAPSSTGLVVRGAF